MTIPASKFRNHETGKLKKRWKFVLLIVFLTLCSAFSLGYFLIANDAPITAGTITRNVEYKPGLMLDVYAPTTMAYEKTPVVVYIHGGAWIGGIKEGLNFNRFNQTANELRASGYAIVSINYTLARNYKSPFPACIEDANDALRWIEAHADQYNFDLNNIGLFGESAGAHIAMMIGYSPADSSTIHFRYLIDAYGPNQLAAIYRSPSIDTLYGKLDGLPGWLRAKLDPAKHILGFDPKQDTVRALQIMDLYSPYNYLTGTAPPTLILHGDKDRVVPLEQSVLLHAKLDSLGIENEFEVIPGADHAFAFATADQRSSLQKHISEFIIGHYKRK
jgi:acetyl esterase/lipase